jgi:hypothetical protein
LSYTPVDGTPDIAASQERDGVAGIDGQCGILGLDPLPLVVDRIPDLQPRDGLAEEQRETTEICEGNVRNEGISVGQRRCTSVTADPIAKGGKLLGCEFGILHIPDMVFAPFLVFVYVAEVVLRKLKRDGEKGVKRVQNFCVKELHWEEAYAMNTGTASVSWKR